jgi:hypothetical protein
MGTGRSGGGASPQDRPLFGPCNMGNPFTWTDPARYKADASINDIATAHVAVAVADVPTGVSDAVRTCASRTACAFVSHPTKRRPKRSAD